MESTFNYNFSNCLIQFSDNLNQFTDNPLYNFEDTSVFNAILLNGDTDFIATQNNNFNIGTASQAMGFGNLPAALLVPLDLNGIDRTTAPDSGAYEHTPEQ